MNRSKNATRNIIFGVLLKIYQIIIPFIIRSVMIYCMGMQYVGLNSLFTSVLQVLNLAELGVGTAMVYSMYKPVAENNVPYIRKLMAIYRLYYRIIGLVVAVVGLIVLPFLPSMIKAGTAPADLNIDVLYVMNLAATVLSYWLFAYKNSLLTAFQRSDLISKVTIVTNTIMYIVQAFVIVLLKNYYLYVMVLLISQVATNVLTAFVVDKKYPKLSPSRKIDKTIIRDINRKIKDLVTAKVGNVVVNSTDTIIISSFLGLSVLAIYQNYFYIMSAVISLITVIFTSVTAGVGNSIITESKEKNFKDLTTFTFIMLWIIGVCCVMFLVAYQPFMEIWVGKPNLMPFATVGCLVLYFYLNELGQVLYAYKDAAGIWHQDRYRPLVTAGVNVILNLMMVHSFKLYGVIFSTVISTAVIGIPWLIYNLFTTLFRLSQVKQYLKLLATNAGCTAFVCAILIILVQEINFSPILSIIIYLPMSFLLVNLIFFIVFRKSVELKNALKLAYKITGINFTKYVH